MKSIHERQRLGKYAFMLVCGVSVVLFLVISNGLVRELEQQERERMHIWAQATEKIARAEDAADFDFLLAIIQQNNSIPVMVTDSAFRIMEFRNFNLPDSRDKGKYSYEELSERNRKYLRKRIESQSGGRPLREVAAGNSHFIPVVAGGHTMQYIYYEDSRLIKRLSLYPYVELGVILVLGMIIYGASVYAKRAEQNRVWAGLSKETAHQLGTPISSLMAWTEYLQSAGTDREVVEELSKDVDRLSMIADRFSKIGSVPELQPSDLNESVVRSLDYMRRRISGRVELDIRCPEGELPVLLSPPLFSWVMENLTKNAVDAMEGQGRITVTTGMDSGHPFIEVHDTGKGIARKNFKSVFTPGFTTKKRGWGLGLALVKRIVETYHRGHIYVKDSEPGRGTTFRIDLPADK